MVQDNSLLVRAHGKIILSGEHAVVYGAPALAMVAPVTLRGKIITADNLQLSFQGVKQVYSPERLLKKVASLEERYRLFLKGKLQIQEILNSPWELAQYLLGLWVDQYPQYANFHLNVSIQNFPIGCGLGASAAFITVILKALNHFFLKEFKVQEWFQKAKKAENLQHGHTSGLDLWVSFYEKAWFFQNGTFNPIRDYNGFYVVNTGTPEISTGECVIAVAKRIPKLLHSFCAITQKIYRAVRDNSPLIELVRVNHLLLVQLGVVPLRVQKFIQELEKTGGAGKISGAGSVSGEKGGIVLAWGDSKKLEALTEAYGYRFICR